MTEKVAMTKEELEKPDAADAYHQLFNLGFVRINDAIEHRFLYVGICLLESLLADRMESCTSDHVEVFAGFRNLAPLLNLLRI